MARQDTAYAYGQPLWLPSKRACPNALYEMPIALLCAAWRVTTTPR
jgi:hypothetical protein